MAIDAQTPPANDIAREWFSKFLDSATKADINKLKECIREDGYWRDMLTFSWDYRTLSGHAKIEEYLVNGDALRKSKMTGLQLDCDAKYASGDADFKWIWSFFTFETAIARGRGVFRLLPDEQEIWKAHVIYTGIDELKGYEELLYSRRPRGVTHGQNLGRESWGVRRKHELARRDYNPDVLIIGAGHSGLMTAARLKQLNVDTLIIDQNDRVGDNWRKRYDFLVLHDPVWYDHFPYMPFPANWPIFTPKDKLADWLESYSKAMELNVWLNTTVASAHYDSESRSWTVQLTGKDGKNVVKPKHVIMATGHSGEPNVPTFKDQERFKGTLVHSSKHTTGGDFKGKKAVVVGCCNSGHDIAQDFVEQGADTTIVQRSSTHIVTTASLLKYRFAGLYEEYGPPVEDADIMFASVPNRVNEITCVTATKLQAKADKEILDGLRKAGFSLSDGIGGGGFLMSYFKRGGGYYFDVGASSLIVDGSIKVKQGHEIGRFTEKGIVFDDGSSLEADIVVLATGYKNMKTAVVKILGEQEGSKMNEVWGLDEEGEIKTMWRPSGHPGLWAMGGNLALCRFNSKKLAIQIKARLTGLADNA